MNETLEERRARKREQRTAKRERRRALGLSPDEIVDKHRMTQRMEAWCLALIECSNALEATRLIYPCGSDASARSYSAKLMRHPLVIERLAELRRPALERAQMSVQNHLHDLLMMREHAMLAGSWAAAVRAEHLRGVVSGYYRQMGGGAGDEDMQALLPGAGAVMRLPTPFGTSAEWEHAVQIDIALRATKREPQKGNGAGVTIEHEGGNGSGS